jgi:hypothetical protein
MQDLCGNPRAGGNNVVESMILEKERHQVPCIIPSHGRGADDLGVKKKGHSPDPRA